MYVGRFLWAFAGIDSAVDNIFEIMFNLNAISYLLLQPNIDLRKKITLIKAGFNDQLYPELDPREEQELTSDQRRERIENKKKLDDICRPLKRIQALHDLRNGIAHSSFNATFDDEGIEFSYVNSTGIAHA
jgi:hypothetical protein